MLRNLNLSLVSRGTCLYRFIILSLLKQSEYELVS